MLCGKGKPTWPAPVRCWPGLRGPQVWPGEAPRCMPAARMSLCGFGLLGDSLGQFIRRASRWRPRHRRKPDVPPGLLVLRPCSAQRPIPLPRSVDGSARGRGHRKLPVLWVGGLDGCAWGLQGVSAVSPRRSALGPHPPSDQGLVDAPRSFLRSLVSTMTWVERIGDSLGLGGKSEGGDRLLPPGNQAVSSWEL